MSNDPSRKQFLAQVPLLAAIGLIQRPLVRMASASAGGSRGPAPGAPVRIRPDNRAVSRRSGTA